MSRSLFHTPPTGPLSDDDWDDDEFGGAELNSSPDTLAPLVQEIEDDLVNGRGKIHYDDGIDDFGDYAPAPAKPWSPAKNHATKTTWGGAAAKPLSTAVPASSWRRGGWRRKTTAYTYDYTYDYTYTRTTYSSWYSGYSSARSAMRGVHRSASGFVRDSSRTSLSIYPTSSESLDLANQHLDDGLHVRIDASLYEELGIEKAQQHYTVDSIGQVLALQAMPNPGLVCMLQNLNGHLPRAIREIVTEVVRRRGLELLASEAPGWVNRIEAFRDAIALQGDVEGTSEHVQRFNALMCAAWLPSDLSNPLAVEAMDIILRLDEVLSGGGSTAEVNAISREIRSWIAHDSDAVQASIAIERILPTIETETLKIQMHCPEPPIPAEPAAEIKAVLAEVKDRIHRIKDARLLAAKANHAQMAGNYLIRDSSIDPRIMDVDRLTDELAKARDRQMEVDRACDSIRVNYEKQLRRKDENGRSVSAYVNKSGLSILWAHVSMKEPVLEVTPLDNTEVPADVTETINQLNLMRSDYNRSTKDLIIAARDGDEIERQLSELINALGEDAIGGIPVWARFASTAGVECANTLILILDKIKENGGAFEEDDFSPKRKRGGGCPENAKRVLAQNHGDLMVEGDIVTNGLPQIGTDEDLSAPPDIIIYEATDPKLIAN